MTISAPSKITTPFAKTGAKNSIPNSSQIGITDGLASFTDGFPPLTMTPVSTGGVPPFGQDMNGILFKLSEAVQFQQAGGSFAYDAGFAAAVGGYPIGAIIQASDNSGFWINQTNNNLTSPETFGAGWLPLEQQGESTVALTSSNVTLTALNAAKNIIIITGTITSNLSVIFPTWAKNYTIINVTSGSFIITAKTASGSGFALSSGANSACCDGVSILGISSGSGSGGLTSGDVNSLISEYMSAHPVVSNGLGVGQAWREVESSRALNTNYTNSTGKPIMVTVLLDDLHSNAASFLVDGNSADYFTDNGGFVQNVKLSAIVPDGSTYHVTVTTSTDGHALPNIVSWYELS